MGIPNIGSANAKLICKAFNNNIEKIRNASVEELIEIDGIGEIMAEKYCQYFADEDNIKKLDNLLKEVNIAEPEENTTPQNMDGLTFVITGSVEHFANRNELKSYIEKHGGKVTGSVSAKTNYLINNDAMSASSKNKKAKQLGVEIVTEEVFLERWCKDIEQ